MDVERIGRYARYTFIGLSIALLLWMWNAFLHNVMNPSEEDAAVIGTGSLWAFEMAALAGVVISKVKHRREVGKYTVVGLGAVLLHGIWAVMVSICLGSVFGRGTAIIGTGAFLALEMAVLTGVIVSKLKDK